MTNDERVQRVAEAIEANSDLSSNGYSQEFIRNLVSDAIAASDATLEITDAILDVWCENWCANGNGSAIGWQGKDQRARLKRTLQATRAALRGDAK